MELFEVEWQKFALICGRFRWPEAGGEDLERIENYLHGLKHGLFQPWR